MTAPIYITEVRIPRCIASDTKAAHTIADQYDATYETETDKAVYLMVEDTKLDQFLASMRKIGVFAETTY